MAITKPPYEDVPLKNRPTDSTTACTHREETSWAEKITEIGRAHV